MSDNLTDDEKKKLVRDIFPSPEVASRIIDAFVSKRPMGYSDKSNLPYFKEVHALYMKKYIDLMMETGNDIVFPYSTFCPPGDITPKTLYQKINQSIRYLVERLDNDQKIYAKWYELVDIDTTYKNNTALRISFSRGIVNGQLDPNTPSPIMTEPPQAMPPWRVKMENWLEGDDEKPFIVEKLALSPEQVTALRKDIKTNCPNVEASITFSHIKLIKTN